MNRYSLDLLKVYAKLVYKKMYEASQVQRNTKYEELYLGAP